MNGCYRFKVNKAIILLGLNYARVVRNEETYGGSIGTRFALYTQQQEEDVIRENIPCGQLSKLSGDIYLEEEGEGLKDHPRAQMRNVCLSPPLHIQPNVWHILFMVNSGDSDVYFVISYRYIIITCPQLVVKVMRLKLV
jgi:hypothetical protein